MTTTLTPLRQSSSKHPEMYSRFLSETAGHQMSIVVDTNDVKHLEFSDPAGGFNGFAVTVTPFRVAINGGMGSYTFSNSKDDTFRSFLKSGINAPYWGEKLRGVDASSGYRNHCEDAVRLWARQQWENCTQRLNEEKRVEVWAHIQETFLDSERDHYDHNFASHTYQAYADFAPLHGFEFETPEDRDFTDYSAQYLWSIHALVWAAECYFSQTSKES